MSDGAATTSNYKTFGLCYPQNLLVLFRIHTDWNREMDYSSDYIFKLKCLTVQHNPERQATFSLVYFRQSSDREQVAPMKEPLLLHGTVQHSEPRQATRSAGRGLYGTHWASMVQACATHSPPFLHRALSVNIGNHQRTANKMPI